MTIFGFRVTLWTSGWFDVGMQLAESERRYWDAVIAKFDEQISAMKGGKR